MATFKTGNGKCKYKDSKAKYDVINYILNPLKTSHCYFGFFDPANDRILSYDISQNVPEIVQSMDDVSLYYNKVRGVQLRHFFVSFAPDELWNYETANHIGYEISAMLSREFQVVYAVNEDTDHINIHFVTNSVRWTNGSRYYGNKAEHYRMMGLIGAVLRKYSIYNLKYVSNNDAAEG